MTRRWRILWAFLQDDVYSGLSPSFEVTSLRRGIPARSRMIELMERAHHRSVEGLSLIHISEPTRPY